MYQQGNTHAHALLHAPHTHTHSLSLFLTGNVHHIKNLSNSVQYNKEQRNTGSHLVANTAAVNQQERCIVMTTYRLPDPVRQLAYNHTVSGGFAIALGGGGGGWWWCWCLRQLKSKPACASMYACVHTQTYTHMHTHIRAHVHTHTHKTTQQLNLWNIEMFCHSVTPSTVYIFHTHTQTHMHTQLTYITHSQAPPLYLVLFCRNRVLV